MYNDAGLNSVWTCRGDNKLAVMVGIGGPRLTFARVRRQNNVTNRVVKIGSIFDNFPYFFARKARITRLRVDRRTGHHHCYWLKGVTLGNAHGRG